MNAPLPRLLTWPEVPPDRLQLLQAFGERIRLNGQRCNLMSANQRPPEDEAGPGSHWWSRHILDSCVPLLLQLPLPGTHIMDLGSGAGFPGIPLAILQPQLSVTLVESIGKKARHLQDVVDHLQLSNCRVCHARAEDLHAHGRQWQLITIRAVGPVARIIPWIRPLLAPGGHAWLWLSRRQLPSLPHDIPPPSHLIDVTHYALPLIDGHWGLARLA